MSHLYEKKSVRINFKVLIIIIYVGTVNITISCRYMESKLIFRPISAQTEHDV